MNFQLSCYFTKNKNSKEFTTNSKNRKVAQTIMTTITFFHVLLSHNNNNNKTVLLSKRYDTRKYNY